MVLLTQAAYARTRGVSKQAINRLVREGVIPAHPHGRRHLIDPTEADACYLPRVDAGEPQLRAVPPRPSAGHAGGDEVAALLAEGRTAMRDAGEALVMLVEAIQRRSAPVARRALERYLPLVAAAWRVWATRVEAELAGRLAMPADAATVMLPSATAAAVGALLAARVEDLIAALDGAAIRAAGGTLAPPENDGAEPEQVETP